MKKVFVLILVLAAAGMLFAQDGFGDIFGSEEVDEPQKNIILNGQIGFNYKSYFDDGWDSDRIVVPSVNFNLLLSSDTVDAKIDLTLKADDLDSALTLDDIVDQILLRSFFSFGYLDLGLFKTEWGKGDGIHVIDPLNPLDQSNGISSDINEMKRSELMVKMNFYIGNNGLLELVYKPYYHSIETASTGRWSVKDLSALPPVQTPPETETSAYSQAAARLTGTLGIFDLGGMYYYGYMTKPGYRVTTVTDIIYTKAQLFGLEAGWALGPFTFRTEGGFWLTEDRKGTEAHLYNDRAVWLTGLDFMIPGTTFFVSVQEFGSYVVNFDSSNLMDMDLGMSYNDTSVTNTVITAIEGSFQRDTMKIRLAGLYLFGANGYMILPSYSWNIEDDLELSVSFQFFGGNDDDPIPYYAWRDNDSITLELKYIF